MKTVFWFVILATQIMGELNKTNLKNIELITLISAVEVFVKTYFLAVQT